MSEKIVFTALGGAASNDENSGIGGSSYLLSCGDEAILIDAGARLSPPEIRAQETAKIIHKLPPREYLKIGNDDYPKLKQIFVSGNAGSGKVADLSDFLTSPSLVPDWSVLKRFRKVIVIITHGHFDHVMGLPYLLRDFPNIEVAMTLPTFDILGWLMNDSRRLQKDGFVDMDIKELEERVIFLEDNSSFNFGRFNIKTFSAGHILGSISLLVSVGGKKIFFSGDISLRDQRIMKCSSVLDEKNLEVDSVITETTNADKTFTETRLEVGRRLAESVIRILDNGGRYILTAPAIGRSQELWSELEWRGITKRYNVYLLGGAKKIAKIYHDRGFLHSYGSTNVGELLDSKKPWVAIAPSGMLMGGSSLALTKIFIDNPKCAIGFSCWQDPYGAGTALLNTKIGDQIIFGGSPKSGGGYVKSVKAKIESFSFSTHPTGAEIMYLADKLKAKKIMMVHGDRAAMDAFQKRDLRITRPLIGESYEM